ncbi:DUF6412 domain-containing protein [Pseudonocardia sp. HH130629-09]|uniref:DUF6412 domain-containing protein n=1 Tax=Pseudonocardia sp. HH130629-09 TaxID=1641402 RepID=UPI0007617C36|nr:DUF6412 domain-containing protein [Pseudonocardia sp. HH130629-09]
MDLGIGRRARDGAALLVASLLPLAPVLLPAEVETGLVGAVVALAVLVWAGHRELGAIHLVATAATTPVREARRVRHRAGIVRQTDPDAAGRPRPRASGPLHPEQVPGIVAAA